MENLGKKRADNLVLADMHCNGVYFDSKIIEAYKRDINNSIIADNSNNQAQQFLVFKRKF